MSCVLAHICCVTQQTCLLCDTSDMSCCVAQQTQTCLLCDAADVSAVSHSRHGHCVAPQTCLLCNPADMSAVSHSRHVCFATQHTCLLCHTAEMSAVPHSRHVPGHRTRGKSQKQMVTPHSIQAWRKNAHCCHTILGQAAFENT